MRKRETETKGERNRHRGRERERERHQDKTGTQKDILQPYLNTTLLPLLKPVPLVPEKTKNKTYLICAPFGNFTSRDSGHSWKKFALLLPAQGQTRNWGLKG
jgi:hypothetical protein